MITVPKELLKSLLKNYLKDENYENNVQYKMEIIIANKDDSKKEMLTYQMLNRFLSEDLFEKKWCTGGTVNTYDGCSYEVDQEVEPKEEPLDNFLIENYPHCTIVQYKEITNFLINELAGETDYYGGCKNYVSKYIRVKDFCEAMVSSGLVENKDILEVNKENVFKLYKEDFEADLINSLTTKKLKIK